MTQVVNKNFIAFDGTPITGRVPAQVIVYAPDGYVVSKELYSAVAHAYKIFCDTYRTSVAQFHVANRTLQDGSRVRMESNQGKDRVMVWVAGSERGGAIQTFFCIPFDEEYDLGMQGKEYFIPRWHTASESNATSILNGLTEDKRRVVDYVAGKQSHPGNQTWFAVAPHRFQDIVVSWWGARHRYGSEYAGQLHWKPPARPLGTVHAREAAVWLNGFMVPLPTGRKVLSACCAVAEDVAVLRVLTEDLRLCQISLQTAIRCALAQQTPSGDSWTVTESYADALRVVLNSEAALKLVQTPYWNASGTQCLGIFACCYDGYDTQQYGSTGVAVGGFTAAGITLTPVLHSTSTHSEVVSIPAGAPVYDYAEFHQYTDVSYVHSNTLNARTTIVVDFSVDDPVIVSVEAEETSSGTYANFNHLDINNTATSTVSTRQRTRTKSQERTVTSSLTTRLVRGAVVVATSTKSMSVAHDYGDSLFTTATMDLESDVTADGTYTSAGGYSLSIIGSAPFWFPCGGDLRNGTLVCQAVEMSPRFLNYPIALGSVSPTAQPDVDHTADFPEERHFFALSGLCSLTINQSRGSTSTASGDLANTSFTGSQTNSSTASVTTNVTAANSPINYVMVSGIDTGTPSVETLYVGATDEYRRFSTMAVNVGSYITQADETLTISGGVSLGTATSTYAWVWSAGGPAGGSASYPASTLDWAPIFYFDGHAEQGSFIEYVSLKALGPYHITYTYQGLSTPRPLKIVTHGEFGFASSVGRPAAISGTITNLAALNRTDGQPYWADGFFSAGGFQLIAAHGQYVNDRFPRDYTVYGYSDLSSTPLRRERDDPAITSGALSPDLKTQYVGVLGEKQVTPVESAMVDKWYVQGVAVVPTKEYPYTGVYNGLAAPVYVGPLPPEKQRSFP